MSAPASHAAGWRDGLAIGLRLTGWLAVNALAALGLVALAFFAIGSFSLSGTMLQLSNLTTRYVAADAARRGQFDTILIVAALLAFAGLSFFRRAGCARSFHLTKG